MIRVQYERRLIVSKKDKQFKAICKLKGFLVNLESVLMTFLEHKTLAKL